MHINIHNREIMKKCTTNIFLTFLSNYISVMIHIHIILACTLCVQYMRLYCTNIMDHNGCWDGKTNKGCTK